MESDRGFKGLNVYKKSYELMKRIYTISKEFPKEEQYGITSQIKRASTSIPLNIAEGYGRQESKADFRRFLLIAKGSAHEMDVLIDMVKDFGYIEEEEYEMLQNGYKETVKMLIGLIKYSEGKE